MQPGQVTGSSGQLTQLASMQLNSSSTGQLLGGPRPAYTATAPTGIAGMTSLYGKLRTQAVQPQLLTQPGDAQPSATSIAAPLAATKTASLASSVGTGGYGWQGQKGAAASATSSDASSILQPQAASISQRLAPLQYSLISQSSASGSRASSLSARSTTSSVAAADQAPAGGLAAAVPVIPAPDGATAAAGAVPAAPAADHKLLEALRLSASTCADTPQDQQAMLSLLLSAQSPALPRNLSTPDSAAYGTAASAVPSSAQLLLTPPTVSSAEKLAESRLLQQLQQMYINESVHAGQHSAQGAQAQAYSSSTQPSSASSQEAMHQQLLMLQVQELQEAQARSGAAGPASTSSAGYELLDSLSTLRASAVAVPQNFLPAQYSGSTTAGACLGPDAVFSFQHAPMPMPNQPAAPAAVSPGLLVLGAQHVQSDSSNEQLGLAQLLTQYGPGASAPVGNSNTHNSMLYSMPSLHSQMPGGPAGLTGPSTGSASLAAAIEEFQQKMLLSSSGLATAAPGGRGVNDSLAGLAAASAAVGGLSGLLPAGKHTLQVGPGNNPMYKVGRFPAQEVCACLFVKLARR